MLSVISVTTGGLRWYPPWKRGSSVLSPISERMLTCLIQNETAHCSFRDTGIDKQNENHTVILSGEKITKKELPGTFSDYSHRTMDRAWLVPTQ